MKKLPKKRVNLGIKSTSDGYIWCTNPHLWWSVTWSGIKSSGYKYPENARRGARKFWGRYNIEVEFEKFKEEQ